MTRTGPLPLRDSKSPCNRPKPDAFLSQQVQNYLYLQGHICCTHDAPQKPWHVLNLDSLNQLIIPFPDNPLEKSPPTFFLTPETAPAHTKALALGHLHSSSQLPYIPGSNIVLSTFSPSGTPSSLLVSTFPHM